jgi:hypothetical protein
MVQRNFDGVFERFVQHRVDSSIRDLIRCTNMLERKERERNDESAGSPIDRNARVTRNPGVASGKRNLGAQCFGWSIIRGCFSSQR